MGKRTIADWETIAEWLVSKPKSFSSYPSEFQRALKSLLVAPDELKADQMVTLEECFVALENKLQQRCTGFLNRQKKKFRDDADYTEFNEQLIRLKMLSGVGQISHGNALLLALNIAIAFFENGLEQVLAPKNSARFDNTDSENSCVVKKTQVKTVDEDEEIEEPEYQMPSEVDELDLIDKLIFFENEKFDHERPVEVEDKIEELDGLLKQWIKKSRVIGAKLTGNLEAIPDEYKFQE